MDEKSEMDLCTSDGHVIANMYKLVLKMNMVDKSVKDWMIKCTQKLDTTECLINGKIYGVKDLNLY